MDCAAIASIQQRTARVSERALGLMRHPSMAQKAKGRKLVTHHKPPAYSVNLGIVRLYCWPEFPM